MAPTDPDFDKLKEQADHLDRLIAEASRLRADVELQMNALRRSGNPDHAGQPERRKHKRATPGAKRRVKR